MKEVTWFNKIKEVFGKYKHYIFYGLLLIFISILSFDGCKKRVETIVFQHTNQKIDSLQILIEKSKDIEDSLKQKINERTSNVKTIYTRVDKIDNDKLKKDEEAIRKSINTDSISVDGIILYWTNELR
jgi:GTP-binding protein EngB required for normal cell division